MTMNNLNKYLESGFKIVSSQFEGIQNGILHQLVTLEKESNNKIISLEITAMANIGDMQISGPVDREFAIKENGSDRWVHFDSQFLDNADQIASALKSA